MFRALYGFFNFIFLIILFKMFAPGIYQLVIQLFTTILVMANDTASAMATGAPYEFPNGI
ncbi:hypothetical protein KKH39_02080 [Patescibacteria group bacterium]|nr:hypothetical protein [Patescibacteria group bacterium]